jgi:hypothetical protein
MLKPLDPFRFLLISLAGWMNQHQLLVIDYLREENRTRLGNFARTWKISSKDERSSPSGHDRARRLRRLLVGVRYAFLCLRTVRRLFGPVCIPCASLFLPELAQRLGVRSRMHQS